MLRIYLDVCCYCRPFDDKTSEKVRLESDAVLLILDRCRSSELTLLGSVAIDEEISYIVDYEKKAKALRAISIIHEYLPITSDVLNLTKSYESYGLHLFDALHCACATVGNSIFLTTDDHIISTIRKNPTFGLIANNPVSWLMKVKYEDDQ